MMIRKRVLAALISSVVLLISVIQLQGAGFALQEQSVSGLGNAFAAGAAAAEDNSALFTNPAALVLLDDAEIQIGVHAVTPDAELTNTGTLSGPAPTQGPDGSTSEKAYVPNIYYTQPISEDLVMGFGVMVPVGLSTEWGSTWFGRYIADRSSIQDLNFQPTLAYSISEQWSIGLGLNYASVEAELSNALDMGLLFLNSVQTGQIPAALVPAAVLGDVQANLGGTKYDGRFLVEGDGYGWGYNVGLLFQPNSQTRIGLHYRSEVETDLDGDVDFEVGLLADYLGPVFPDGKGQVSLTLPSITNLSVHYQINDAFALMADAQYTTWSSFDELVIEFEQPTPPDSRVPEQWEDVWRFALGLSYKANDAWKFRAGIAKDESPVPGPAYRSPRIPDADRIWYSTGFEYRVTSGFRINGAFSLITVASPIIDNDTHASGYHMKADMDASVSIFSLSAIFAF